MYDNHFGFKERPFKLVPNPVYLFLSASHEEALAHLAYSVNQGDGFAVIIGEVGTGKTTLCRVFLERLGKDVKAAFIFNPKLRAIQLLKAINDEFEIDSSPDDSKDLIDNLNSFLLKQKELGFQAILLIDEAQNLTQDVLEQLRLLSNLETTRDKLLQIILVGQPELGDLLDSFELRQLRQRITLNCVLQPMSYQETRAYIEHRVNLASDKPSKIFSNGACKAAFDFSGGIPRLVNIACDRALLNAFSHNRRTVSTSTAKEAIQELNRHTVTSASPPVFTTTRVILAILLIISLTAFVFQNNIFHRIRPHSAPQQNIPATSSSPNTQQQPAFPLAAASLPAPQNTSEPVEVTPVSAPANLSQIISHLELDSRNMALKTALGLWGKDPDLPTALNQIQNNYNFFVLGARQHGLMVQKIDADFSLLQKLNLPAILEVYPPDRNTPRFLTLCGLSQGVATICRTAENTAPLVAPMEDLEAFYKGTAYIPWRNYLDLIGVIPLNSSGNTILTMKIYLKELGYENLPMTPAYDPETRATITALQGKYGILQDGLVGPTTKLILYLENHQLSMPRLMTLKENATP